MTDQPQQTALSQLYELMRDNSVSMRVRLNSAIRASRVEPLAMPGEEPPPAVAFLRNIMNFRHNGQSYSAGWRSEAGSALAYYERRARKAELQYEVPDQEERIAAWKRTLDSLLRQRIWAKGHWPEDRDALAIPFTAPECDPDLATTALIVPVEQQQRRVRQKAIDEPIAERISSNRQRLEILREVAVSLQQRVMGLGHGA